jgi:hypothetical protein
MGLFTLTCPNASTEQLVDDAVSNIEIWKENNSPNKPSTYLLYLAIHNLQEAVKNLHNVDLN